MQCVEQKVGGIRQITVRVQGPHAITIRYNTSQRSAHYPDISDAHQSVKTISLLYTYIFGDGKFGAVDWRAADGF